MRKILLFPLNLKGKTSSLIEKIREENLIDDFTYITSNFCKVKDFKINYFNKFKNSSLPPSFTLKSLAKKIIEERSNKKIITGIEKYLILLQIIKEGKNEIAYTDEGFARIVSNFIKELKISLGSELEIQELKKEILNYDFKFDNCKKNIEIALDVFSKYQNYLEEKNLIDEEDIYFFASKILEKGDFKNVIFENILEIPKYQREFLSGIIDLSENVIFSYFKISDFSPDTQEFILKDTLNFLNEIGKWENEEMEGERYNPEIVCFNFSNMEEEVKGIVELIYEESKKNKGITLNDFIITCPDILSYREHIKRIFSRFNIPVEIIPGYTLIKEVSISSIFEFLTFSETYDWTSLMNILTSPYFTEFDREKVYEFSKKAREIYKNKGFYRDDFEKFEDKNIKKIKDCLKLIPDERAKLKEWKNIVKKIIEETGWSPPDIEVKIEFERIIEKLNSDYFLSKEGFINLMNKIFEMVEVEEGKGYGIRVSGIIEGLGIEKKICFFCGATDKNFPNAPKFEEFFLPDNLKRKIGLEFFEKRVARDRSDFYRIKNEHEKLIFTYPSKVDEELQMKSIFIFDIPEEQIYKKIFFMPPRELFKIEIDFEKFKKKYVKNKKLEIDITYLEELLRCPLEFYLERVEEIKPYRIPSIKEVLSLWGDIIHKSFQKTFEDEKNKPIENGKMKQYREKFEYFINEGIREAIEEEKISVIYSKILELRKDEIIKKFENIIEKHEGRIFLDFEKKIEFEIENLKLKGKVDIIEKYDERKLAIIDIKTGTSLRPSYTDTDFFKGNNIQLPLYIWVYANQYKFPYENLLGIIWYFNFLEDDKNIEKPYDFTKTGRYNYKYLHKIEEYLNQIAERIINEKFSFIPENGKCEYFCEYKEGCVYAE